MKTVNLILCFILPAAALQAQVVIDTTQTVTSTVEDMFLGNGVFVANITFNGQSADVLNNQFGRFTDVANGIGIAQGLCMSSGSTANMAESETFFMGPMTPYVYQDPDILSLLPDEPMLYDLASLEFDFIATGDICNFQYVFGSDEYPDWVESFYNDHFGFFISGPGLFGPFINGAENIALIPGTTEHVSINTLNSAEHAEFYIDNTMLSTNVGFNAFTTVLEAHIENLIVGEVYHVKLIVADVADPVLDSGVFLRGDSFQQACSEKGPTGVQTETCMLSNLDAQVHYTQDCGTIYMTNLSEMNIETTNCYFEMGDGNTTSACGDNTTYTYAEPGVYTLKLVYEIGEFRTKYIVDNIYVSATAPATPIINLNEEGTFLEIQNWDGVSSLQWYLNGDEISGAINTMTGVEGYGIYTVAAINGCMATSEGFQINTINNQRAPQVLQVYPNPSKDFVLIKFLTLAGELLVYNSTGQLIIRNDLLPGREVLMSQPAGVYVVQLVDSNGKIIAQERLIME